MEGALVPIYQGELDAQPAVPDSLMGFDAKVYTEAAEELGFRRFNARGLLASANIGAAVKQLGAMKVGRGGMVMAADSANYAISQCDDLLEGSTDAKLKTQIVGFKAQLIKLMLEGHIAIAKSAESDESDGAQRQSPRAPGRGSQVPVIHAQNALVSVNQSVNNTQRP